MVTKNEARRYLELALQAVCPVVDEMFVFDDRSTDETLDVAASYGCHTWQRPEHVPAFLEHEGRFRQAAWDRFCATVVPDAGDWVLAVDADEILLAANDARQTLLEAADHAQRRGEPARVIKIPEVFDVRCGWPYIRVDGWWGRIQGSRFFVYRPDGVYADKPMACGSEPTYIPSGRGEVIEGLWLLHLGYAAKADRVEKYRRYSGRSGHGDTHVASILKEPDLARWYGPEVVGLHRHFA